VEKRGTDMEDWWVREIRRPRCKSAKPKEKENVEVSRKRVPSVRRVSLSYPSPLPPSEGPPECGPTRVRAHPSVGPPECGPTRVRLEQGMHRKWRELVSGNDVRERRG